MNDNDFNRNPHEHELPQIPEPRTFKVTRFERDDEAFETRREHIIHAHELGYNGDVIIFTTYRIDPVLGPSAVVTRAFNGWEDLEEITAVRNTTNLIIQ